MADCGVEWLTSAEEEDFDGDAEHACGRGEHDDELHVCHRHPACWPLQGYAWVAGDVPEPGAGADGP